MWVPSAARPLATSGDSNRVPKAALNLEEAELPSRTFPMIPNVGVHDFREGHGRDFTFCGAFLLVIIGCIAWGSSFAEIRACRSRNVV